MKRGLKMGWSGKTRRPALSRFGGLRSFFSEEVEVEVEEGCFDEDEHSVVFRFFVAAFEVVLVPPLMPLPQPCASCPAARTRAAGDARRGRHLSSFFFQILAVCCVSFLLLRTFF